MNPFDFFDDIRCINLDSEVGRWRRMEARFVRLGIADRVRRLAAVPTPFNHHVGCALSHRQAIAEADRAGARHLLVFEDDVLFLDRCSEILGAALAELGTVDWNLCYLGATRWEPETEHVAGCRHLVHTRYRTSLHAVAIHRRLFDFMLSTLPAEPEAMTEWVGHHAVDQCALYMPPEILRGVVGITPQLATQPILLPYEDPAEQFRFTL